MNFKVGFSYGMFEFSKFSDINNISMICVPYNTVGPNRPKLSSWGHIWEYICNSFSYSRNLWTHDSQWKYKKLNKPKWPYLGWPWNDIRFFFSTCPSFNHILSPKLCENEKFALIRFWGRHYGIHAFFFWLSK